ncbi:MAG TPA: hypothetical protein VEV63_13180 [Streptosporangiaceae bacterium]|nr:hypothetical protein [Streptosporangiaceae bacterium]
MSPRLVRLLAAPIGLAGAFAAIAVLANGPAASAAYPAAFGGTWRTARELPGIGSLNKGGNSALLALSCGSPGNCAAGGYYSQSGGRRQAFVADERNGAWRAAAAVPGIAALNKGGDARVLSVSCATAGNCAAGGMYLDASGHYQAFVVTEKNGRWAKGIIAPGTGTLNKGGQAATVSVSCGQAGNCAAGGNYRDGSAHSQAFLLNSVNGAWRAAKPVPSLATLNIGNDGELDSLSCAGVACSAGGLYVDGSGAFQGFVVTAKNGKWGAAREVPGLGALNVGGFARVSVVSCASAGNCAAGGLYHTGPSQVQAFVATEVNGGWGTAQPVPGTLALNTGQDSFMSSLSCASAGNCSGAGSYTDSLGHSWPFVVTEKNGTWGTAVPAPGVHKLSVPLGFGEINALSCASAGNCAGAGQYDDATSHQQAFVIVQRNGTWTAAIKVPGLLALNKDNSAVAAVVSCRAPSTCIAGGFYHDAFGRQEPFVIARR